MSSVPAIEQLVWGILLLPLISAAGITLFGLRRPRLAGVLSVGAAAGVAVLSLLVFTGTPFGEWWECSAEWLSVGELNVPVALRFDPLSLTMGLIVAWVSFVIHVYSLGYMRGDRGFGRYFAGLSLFLFSMLLIVLAGNLLVLFIGWELVGVSSYLLIGFWYQRPAAADASKKAFLLNRLGDFGFLVGLLLVWSKTGTVDISELECKLALDPGLLGSLATAAGLLIFCGVLGKSAQFPLHVWLPDAMEGPTPVSALIHAATMVAAGVYLLCRVFFLLALPGSAALELIAWVGAFTALLAAVIATQQDDIKRILAYSTLSQLGYMVMAVGASSVSQPPVAAMYHLSTHACFKALLFLGAGSVICAVHHEQNIWRMGALGKKMPVTFVTFLIAALALAGVPPLSGFFSKESILASVLESNVAARHALFAVAVAVAALTGFYMTRLVAVTFFGPERTQIAGQARESGMILTIPLLILAVPSAFAGFWGIDSAYASQFKGAAVEHAGVFGRIAAAFTHSPVATLWGLGAAIVGIVTGLAVYWNAATDRLPEKLGLVAGWARNRFYFDELYAALNEATHEFLSRLADGVDRWVISGIMVRGVHGSIELAGRLLRLTQTGNIQIHAVLLGAGIAILLLIVLRH
ncbi:MAG: NADH-quinone oxidoreductase subunit L [Verrucomicrobia bacterium]|nr:NADH-quinone oxidoreductase subunit L [Verrucomicrobiota bacterium]